MMNKLEKKFKRCLVVSMASIIAISLMGCESKELAKGDAVNKETVVEKNSVNNNKAYSKELPKTEAVSIEKTENNKDNNEDTKEIKTTATSKSPEVKKQSNSEKAVLQNNKPINKTKIDDGKRNFKDYISLLGLSKEKLISTLKEKPSSIGEGGVEFKEAGIRVWFDKKSNTQVDQVFTMRKDINLNGVKIGDKIGKFKEVFGSPVSDKNGDAHFKYNGVFLSINYDTNTGETYAVYILRKDF